MYSEDIKQYILNKNDGAQDWQMEYVANDKYFTCQECSMSFSNERILQRHPSSCTQKKSHSCHVFNKTFLNKGKLTVHLKRHSSQKTFSCTKCNESFSRSTNLQRHLKIHFG